MEQESNSQQEGQAEQDRRPTGRFHWRALISVTIALSFVAMSITGVVLFVTPPGRIAHWTGWRMLSLTKEQWGGLHIWFSLLFMIVAVVHLYLNWRCFLSYFRDRVRRAFALRGEWLVALLLCGVIGWATVADVKPFSSLLIWNDAVKHRWETPAGEAPVAHREPMARGELTTRAEDLETESMVKDLQTAGAEEDSPDVILRDLAKDTEVTPRPFRSMATGQSRAPRIGRGAGRQNLQGGYGIGRLTLRQYCEQQNLDTGRVIKILRENGFRAGLDMTMREVAATGGAHPSAMRDILAR